MDIGLPGYDGLEATRRIKSFLDCRVLVLTSHSEERFIFDALEAGAAGYCLKGASPAKLENAVNTVARGVAWLDEKVSATVLKSVV
jgi:DNA-binding NarL/FixJ family response regulator